MSERFWRLVPILTGLVIFALMGALRLLGIHIHWLVWGGAMVAYWLVSMLSSDRDKRDSIVDLRCDVARLRSRVYKLEHPPERRQAISS